MIEIAYPLAPLALLDEGATWTHDGRPRRLISWRWLRYTRFINAIATYEDNFRLFYCWVGRSVTPPMLRWRYENRFERHRNVATRSEGDDLERRRDKWAEPPDPDLDLNPHVSGVVVVTPDMRGAEVAMEVLPSERICGPPPISMQSARGRPRIYTGTRIPAPHDDVRGTASRHRGGHTPGPVPIVLNSGRDEFKMRLT